MGTVGLADVRQAGAAGPLMLFQLYVFKERDFVKQLIQREMYACMQIASWLPLDWYGSISTACGEAHTKVTRRL